MAPFIALILFALLLWVTDSMWVTLIGTGLPFVAYYFIGKAIAGHAAKRWQRKSPLLP